MSEEAVEVHKADPRRRWLLLLLIPPGAAALYALSHGFSAYLDHLPTDSTGQMRQSSVAVLAAIRFSLYGAGALLAMLALYWFSVSRRMHAAERYPLPQMRLFHDMRVLRGAAKQARVRQLRLGAALAAAAAVVALGAGAWYTQRQAQAHPVLFDQSQPDHRFDEVWGKPKPQPQPAPAPDSKP